MTRGALGPRKRAYTAWRKLTANYLEFKIFHACYANKFDLFFVALQQFVNLC